MTRDTKTSADRGAEARARYARSSGSDRGSPPKFIKRRLSDIELESAKAAADTYSDVGEIVSQMIDEGFKFSASHDTWGGGVQVFMTPGDPEDVNAGFTLSARAPTLIAAVAVLCYKHYTLFSRDWPKDDDGIKGPNWG